MEETFELKVEDRPKIIMCFLVLFLVTVYATYSNWYILSSFIDEPVLIIIAVLFAYSIFGILLARLLMRKYVFVVNDTELSIYKGDALLSTIPLEQISSFRHIGGAGRISDSIFIFGSSYNDKILELKEIPKQSHIVRPMVKRLVETGKFQKKQIVFKSAMCDEYTPL